MKLFSIEQSGYPKTLLILVAIFLVAAGLCGAQFVLGNSASGGVILIPLGIVELIAMLLSAGGIVVVLLLWAGTALHERFGKPHKDEVLKLFDDKDDTKPDGPR